MNKNISEDMYEFYNDIINEEESQLPLGGAMHKRKKNKWDAFEHKHKGMYSREQLVKAYHDMMKKHKHEKKMLNEEHKKEKHMIGKALVGGADEDNLMAFSRDRPELDIKHMLQMFENKKQHKENPWIDFLKMHKNSGMSRKQLVKMYHEKNGGILSFLL